MKKMRREPDEAEECGSSICNSETDACRRTNGDDDDALMLLTVQ